MEQDTKNQNRWQTTKDILLVVFFFIIMGFLIWEQIKDKHEENINRAQIKTDDKVLQDLSKGLDKKGVLVDPTNEIAPPVRPPEPVKEYKPLPQSEYTGEQSIVLAGVHQETSTLPPLPPNIKIPKPTQEEVSKISPNDITDEKLSEITKQLNATIMPMKLGPNIRVDNVISGHKMFRYNATILSATAAQIPKGFVEAQSDSVIKAVCSDNGLSALLNTGITIIYFYKSNDGKPVGDIQITADDCNKV